MGKGEESADDEEDLKRVFVFQKPRSEPVGVEGREREEETVLAGFEGRLRMLA